MDTGRRSEGRRGRTRSLVIAVGLVVLFAAPGRTQDEVVKVGDIPQLSNAGMYIAIEKGYFRQQGIRNEITTFASAARTVPAFAAGEVEISMGAASAGLFNAIAQGAPFRIVADKGQNKPGFGYSMLSVRKDLLDSGQIRSLRDLRGRKVATFAKGITLDYMLGRLAEEERLTIKDFELVFIAAPNQLAALESKAVDAALTVEPWGARLEERGLATRFRTADQVKGTGSVQSGVVMYSGGFIKERRPVAQRWMEAYLKGCDLYTSKGLQDDEIVAILEKHTKVPAKAIKAATPYYLARDGRPNLDSLADMIQWFVANGYMPQKVGVDQAVDLSFLK